MSEVKDIISINQHTEPNYSDKYVITNINS